LSNSDVKVFWKAFKAWTNADSAAVLGNVVADITAAGT